MKQHELLLALGFHRREVLLMGCSQIGEYSDSWLYDVTQGCHLTRLADTSLEHTYLSLLI